MMRDLLVFSIILLKIADKNLLEVTQLLRKSSASPRRKDCKGDRRVFCEQGEHE